MDIQTIVQLVEIIENSTLSALEAEQDGLKVRLECHNGAGFSTKKTTQEQVATLKNKTTQEAVQCEKENDSQSDIPENAKEIRSPMVGTFHVAKNDKTKVGSKFKKGETIAIIEAMKLMNEIVAQEDGEIVWLAVSQGETVEFEQLLFMYK